MKEEENLNYKSSACASKTVVPYFAFFSSDRGLGNITVSICRKELAHII